MNEQHQDFRYVPESELAPVSKVSPVKSAQRTHNDIAHRAASLCWRIRNTFKPEEWAEQIAAAPEDIRECLREHMRQAWRELQDRKRREAGKRSSVGDAELAKMAEHVRRM